jgi:hypothetical protein
MLEAYFEPKIEEENFIDEAIFGALEESSGQADTIQIIFLVKLLFFGM